MDIVTLRRLDSHDRKKVNKRSSIDNVGTCIHRGYSNRAVEVDPKTIEITLTVQGLINRRSLSECFLIRIPVLMSCRRLTKGGKGICQNANSVESREFALIIYAIPKVTLGVPLVYS